MSIATIEFGKSRSKQFGSVLEKMRNEAESFEEFKPGKLQNFIVKIDIREPQKASNLLSLVTKWKVKFTAPNGQVLPITTARDILSCISERNSSDNKARFCHEPQYTVAVVRDANAPHPFGCQLFGPAEWPYCSYYDGRFEESDFTYIVDREAVFQIYQERLIHFRFCPNLNEENVLEALNCIPEKIDPMKHRNWEFNLELESNGFVTPTFVWWNGEKWKATSYGFKSAIPTKENVIGVCYKDRTNI